VLGASVWTSTEAVAASLRSSDSGDPALARRAALNVSDLPAGWREKKHNTAGEKKGDAVRNGIRECRSYQEIRKLAKKSPLVNRDFAKSSSSEIDSTVAVLPTDQQARRVLSASRDRDVAACIEKSLKKLLADELIASQGRGGTVTALDVGALSVEPVGDETTGYEVVATLSAQGLSPKLYLDVEFVRVGRAVAYFVFTDLLSPLTDGRDSAVNAVVGRLAGAASSTTTATTTTTAAGSTPS